MRFMTTSKLVSDVLMNNVATYHSTGTSNLLHINGIKIENQRKRHLNPQNPDDSEDFDISIPDAIREIDEVPPYSMLTQISLGDVSGAEYLIAVKTGLLWRVFDEPISLNI